MEAIATAAKSVPKRKPRRKIPEALIYETAEGASFNLNKLLEGKNWHSEPAENVD